MPSILGHAIVGATAAQLSLPTRSTNSSQYNRRLFWILSLICSLIPDADGLTFMFGIPYDSFFGHRGFFHSIPFAAAFGVLAALVYLKSFKVKSKQDWGLVAYFFLVTLIFIQAYLIKCNSF